MGHIELKKNNRQLELPFEEFNIVEKIKQMKIRNQSFYNLHKGLSKDIYQPKTPNKTYRDERGDIIGFSISLEKRLKPEYVLYKEYSREELKLSWLRDIVIKENILLNLSDHKIEVFLTKIYEKAKKRNKNVFIYQVDDELLWNKIFYRAISVFHDYPISIIK